MILRNVNSAYSAENAREVYHYISPKPMEEIWDGWRPQVLV